MLIRNLSGNLHLREHSFPENRCERCVGRVSSISDPKETGLGRESRRIKKDPLIAQKRLEMGMEVWRV
jgi:hypothetical protein